MKSLTIIFILTLNICFGQNDQKFIGTKIQDFELPDKDGKLIKLSSLKEKIIIIELWTTWCGPCLKEMRKIQELKKDNSNIEFYSISFDKTIDKMKKFVEKNRYDWPIVFGGEKNMELRDYFNIVTIPKYLIVDREGIIINITNKLDDQLIRNLK
jgi:thiol-disulfide isomerase/thioredoxin